MAIKLEHSFVVLLPPEQVWQRLSDIEQVVPFIPGAHLLDAVDDHTWNGEMGLKLGPLSLAMKGTIVVAERDEDARSIRILAQGKDQKGKGGAAMQLDGRVERVEEGTRVLLSQEIKTTGPIAQFGRGVVQDVSKRLTRQFVASLEASMQSDPSVHQAGANSEGTHTSRRRRLSVRAIWQFLTRTSQRKSEAVTTK